LIAGLAIATMVCTFLFIGSKYTFYPCDRSGQKIGIMGTLAAWGSGSIEDGICSITIENRKHHPDAEVYSPVELKSLFPRCGYHAKLVFHETTSYGTSISLFWGEGKNKAILYTFPETNTGLVHNSADPALERSMETRGLNYKCQTWFAWFDPYEAWGSPFKFGNRSSVLPETVRGANTIILEKKFGPLSSWGFRSTDDFSYFLGYDQKMKKWKLYEQGFRPGREKEWLMQDLTGEGGKKESTTFELDRFQPISADQKTFLEEFQKN